MRMDYAIDVRPRPENLGMDIDLAGSPRRPGNDIPLQIDGQDILHRDLVESDAVCLHKKQVRFVGQAKGNMTAGKIVLAFSDEHFSRKNQLLFERSMRRPLSRPLRPRRFFVRSFPFDHCPPRLCSMAGATEQGIGIVSSEKCRGGARAAAPPRQIATPKPK